jgi:dolichyl-phosphate beta-glucosyltransferase
MITKSLSVIIPAYNEGANIRRIIASVSAFLKDNFSDSEIVVVDDGSIDDTAAVLKEICASGTRLTVVTNQPNKGKGRSVRRGVEAASKEYALMSDADLSTPLKESLKFFDYLAQGFDIVIGSRALPDSRLAVRQGILRRSMGKTFNFILQRVLFRGIRDTQCGFKLFKAAQAKELFALQRVERFCFDAEVLFIAKRKGLRIKEAGVEWANRQESRVAIFRDSLGMFIDLFRIRLNAWKGCYDPAR